MSTGVLSEFETFLLSSYVMLGSPQDDRQRYLYCGEALQEAEDGECYKLYLHKEDEKLPQNQKRAQVAFSDN